MQAQSIPTLGRRQTRVELVRSSDQPSGHDMSSPASCSRLLPFGDRHDCEKPEGSRALCMPMGAFVCFLFAVGKSKPSAARSLPFRFSARLISSTARFAHGILVAKSFEVGRRKRTVTSGICHGDIEGVWRD